MSTLKRNEGHFITAQYPSTCKETRLPIVKGDRVYYIPSKGVYSSISRMYKQHDKPKKKTQTYWYDEL
jgi:hypothetical protein